MAFLRLSSTLFPLRYKQTELSKIFTAFCETKVQAPGLNRLVSQIFKNSTINSRGFLFPPFNQPKHDNIGVKNHYWGERMAQFSASCIQQALAKANIKPGDVTAIFSSANVQSIPAIGLSVTDHLNCSPNTNMVAFEGMGCVGGTGTIIAAFDTVKARPKSVVVTSTMDCASIFWNGSFNDMIGHLLPYANELFPEYDSKEKKLGTPVNTELRELITDKDRMRSEIINGIVCASLVGDGASASIILGKDHPDVDKCPLEILNTHTSFLEGTSGLAYQRITNSGFTMHISPELQNVVPPALEKLVDQTLEENHLTKKDIKFLIVHPGGPKILKKSQNLFGMNDSDLMWSWKALRDVGNAMGATVIYALETFLASNTLPKGSKGLILSVGPGMRFNSILVQTR